MVKQTPGASQSRYVLLGLLQSQAGSGYGLRQRIDRSIGHFWRESWGQIYPALREMEKEGLVEGRVEAGERRPDSRIYSITVEGTEVLRQWLLEAPRRELPRNELLLKLFLSHRSQPEQSRQMVEELRVNSLALLATYAAIEESLLAMPAESSQRAYCLMTLSYGQHRVRAELAWCDETMATLDRLASEGAERTVSEEVVHAS